MANLSGQITEKWSNKPISGASIIIAGQAATTDSNGRYSLNLLDGNYSIQIVHANYEAWTGYVYVPVNLITQNYQLTPILRSL